MSITAAMPVNAADFIATYVGQEEPGEEESDKDTRCEKLLRVLLSTAPQRT